MKGLMLFVYRAEPIGEGIPGISRDKRSIVVIDESLPGIFAPTEEMPAYRIDHRNVLGDRHSFLIPIGLTKQEVCFSGRYACTSDSRWGRPPMQIQDSSRY